MEIVSEPDIRTPEQAQSFLTQLKSLLEHLDVSDVNMEEGSLRCDANVSVRHPGEPFGTKTELKNMNSFRFVQRGLEAEIERQIDLLDHGERVVQRPCTSTRPPASVSLLRSKEEAHDYRYFPEPDLVPIVLDAEYVERVRASLPELPAARKERLIQRVRPVRVRSGHAGAHQASGRLLRGGLRRRPATPSWRQLGAGRFSGYLNASSLEVEQSQVTPARLAALLGLLRTARSRRRWPRRSSRS